jgi:DNA-binding NtrC family response regulator
LLTFTVRRVVGEDAGHTLAEVAEWVQKKLPAGYAWPGNYRELEQCVRNIVIRREYQPMSDPDQHAASDGDLLVRMNNGALTADDLISQYAALVYTKTGSYEETARRLALDRRTVKSKVEKFLRAFTPAG